MSKIYESLSREGIIRELSRCNLVHVNDDSPTSDYSDHFCISTMKLIESLETKVERMRNNGNCSLAFSDNCPFYAYNQTNCPCIKWKLKE